MKAAILHELKRPLTIEEVVQPKAAAHEVLIEVQACGVCHSDLHVANGDWPQIVPITKTPLILDTKSLAELWKKAPPSVTWKLAIALASLGCTGPAANANSAAKAMRIFASNNKLLE